MTFFWIDGPVFHCFFSQINSICSKNARFIVRWSAFSRFPNLFLLFLHFRVAFPTVSNLFYTSVSLSGDIYHIPRTGTAACKGLAARAASEHAYVHCRVHLQS